jgi:hypothetical protein
MSIDVGTTCPPACLRYAVTHVSIVVQPPHVDASQLQPCNARLNESCAIYLDDDTEEREPCNPDDCENASVESASRMAAAVPISPAWEVV